MYDADDPLDVSEDLGQHNQDMEEAGNGDHVDSFFREAILMMELPRRHAASLERAAGSHPIRVQSMGGGRGRDRAQMTYSSSGLLSGSVWQMRRLWLAAHQTPPACASIP